MLMRYYLLQIGKGRDARYMQQMSAPPTRYEVHAAAVCGRS